MVAEGDWTYMQGGRVDTASGSIVGARGPGVCLCVCCVYMCMYVCVCMYVCACVFGWMDGWRDG